MLTVKSDRKISGKPEGSGELAMLGLLHVALVTGGEPGTRAGMYLTT
ncbi:hypothetical protein ACNKHS_21070 [Shigella flexneri]